MNNNWKEEFDNLMDNYLRHFADAVISKRVIESINKEQDNILYSFIESLLAEQKKEYDKIIEKIHKNHQIELKKAIDACNRNADIIESLNHHD